jgi:prepilin-type processing-associated H-X9-DG protein
VKLNRSRTRRRAFTLIELLVIIFILMLGLALMTPLLLNARAQKVSKSCAGNLEQIGKGLVVYSADNDDTLPMAHHDAKSRSRSSFSWEATPAPEPATWADLILPYMPTATAFVCPVDDSGRAEWPKRSGKRSPGNPISYAMNGYFYHQPGVNRETQTGGGLTELSSASSKLLVVESTSASGLILMTPAEASSHGRTPAWERHLNGANWLLADGHTAFHALSRAFKAISAKVWEDPNMAGRQPFSQWFPWIKAKPPEW